MFPLQVLSILPKLSGSWPKSLQWIFDFASFTMMDIELYGTECSVPKYWNLWDLKILLPLLIILCFIILLVVDRCLEFLKHYFQRKSIQSVNWDRYILSFTTIMNFMILPFLSFVIEPFVCIKYSQDKIVVASRPSIECYSKEWNQRLPVGIVMITLYGVIMPLLYAYSLFQISERNFIHLRNRFGSMITNYKYQFLWWEIVVYTKKVLIFVIPVLMNANVSLRVLICVLVLLLFLLVEELVKPFKEFSKRLINLM
jgi:hypothetical protein